MKRGNEMAKRFLETTIFDKQWFRKLSPKLKLAWFYIISRCNHAGIWECDIELMSFQIGDSYTLQELLDSFGENIESLGDDKYYLTKFISYQYGLPLNPKVKVHSSAIKILNKYNIPIEINDIESNANNDVLHSRKKTFINRVEKEVADMNVSPIMLKEFLEYWMEHNPVPNAKMKWEKTKSGIFNPRRRMRTWIRLDKKYKKENSVTSVNESALEEQRKKRIEYMKKAEADACSDEDKKEILSMRK